MSALGTPCNPIGPCDLDLTCVRCEPGVSDENCVRYKLDFMAWSHRQNMICGRLPHYFYTISPHGKQFIVTPALTENTKLQVVWDGYKYSFGDDEEVQFPPEAAEAVAAYVMWKIARTVDKNLPLSKEYEQDYLKLRLALFRDFNEGQFPDGKDEEYDQRALPAGSTGGTVNTSITSWTDLMAIPTTSIATGSTILWNDADAGVERATQIRESTEATDIPAGIARPDDYDFTTNPRVWFQAN